MKVRIKRKRRIAVFMTLVLLLCMSGGQWTGGGRRAKARTTTVTTSIGTQVDIVVPDEIGFLLSCDTYTVGNGNTAELRFEITIQPLDATGGDWLWEIPYTVYDASGNVLENGTWDGRSSEDAAGYNRWFGVGGGTDFGGKGYYASDVARIVFSAVPLPTSWWYTPATSTPTPTPAPTQAPTPTVPDYVWWAISTPDPTPTVPDYVWWATSTPNPTPTIPDYVWWTPTPTPTPVATPIPTPTPTVEPWWLTTPTPTVTPTPTAVPTATVRPTATPTAVPTATVRPTAAPTPTPTPMPTVTPRPTAVPTATAKSAETPAPPAATASSVPSQSEAPDVPGSSNPEGKASEAPAASQAPAETEAPAAVQKGKQTISISSSIKKTLGDTAFELKPSGNIHSYLTFKSSDKKVASVTSYGSFAVVKLNKAGKVKITIQAPETDGYKSAKKTITLKISLDSPKLKVTVKKGMMTIQWSKVKGASKYQVSVTQHGVKTTTLPLTKKTKISNTVTSGKKYTVKVRAMDSKKKFPSAWSKKTVKT